VTLAAADVASPRRTALEDAIPVTGNLQPLERAEVRARLEGDLLGVYVREGEPVRAGQLLARFEASEQAGSARSAGADVAAARSEMSTAQWNLDQSKELYRQGAVPERDVRVAEQAVAASRARVAAAESRLGSTRSEVGDTRVLAPTNGIVEKRNANPGEHVSRGASLFTVVRGDVLELAAAVPERRAAGVRAGQTVKFTADAREFTGRVARIGPSVDPGSRAVTVYVQIPNPDGALKAGTFASGRIVSRVVDDAMVLPAAAIREAREGGKPFVYRVVDGQIDVAEVTPGLADEAQGLVQVNGLTEGDKVVVGNVGVLGKGMKVRMAGEGRPRGGR
jgi:RND family efflux transporter MFP subunit